jgi:hypothetical protein
MICIWMTWSLKHEAHGALSFLGVSTFVPHASLLNISFTNPWKIIELWYPILSFTLDLGIDLALDYMDHAIALYSFCPSEFSCPYILELSMMINLGFLLFCFVLSYKESCKGTSISHKVVFGLKIDKPHLLKWIHVMIKTQMETCEWNYSRMHC